LGILVVGSVGLDNIETPVGRRERTIGGACTYFSTAASLYERVHVVGVVGTDFPQDCIDFLKTRNIDLQGLQIVEGKTFFWAGCYGQDLDNCETLDTQLNVFADFHPVVPPDLTDAEYVFLANIDPDLQLEVLKQVRKPKLTALDSMNYWITSKRDALTRVIGMVDVLFLNEGEARLLAGEQHVLKAARRILDMGPEVLVIKKGEHGAMLITRSASLGDNLFLTPAYPLENVVDPTGAGDTFAAGFMGYLAKTGALSVEAFRRAVVHGTVVASFTVQDFSIDRLRTLTWQDLQGRYDEFRRLTYFEALEGDEREHLQSSIHSSVH
jgi:sugar/nucleoside kinase (ribokinase family)